MRKVAHAAAIVALLAAVMPTATAIAVEPPGAEVSEAVRHDVSMPLSGAAPASPTAHQLTERPLRLTGAFSGPGAPDGAVQQTSGPLVGTSNGTSFAGVGQGDYGWTDQYAPPDTSGAVGATQYVQVVNTGIGVWNKSTGAMVAGFPKQTNALWAGFGGGCQNNNDGDAVVQYDKLANRWVITQFSVSTTPYLECVAVSTTSDATGTYNRYAFSYGNTEFNDYPKLSVWPDGYYVTYNIFANARTYSGPKACALDRAKMLAGAAATQQCFQLASSVGPLLASDVDGTTAPPAGAPNHLVTMNSSTSLNLYRFHVDWANPANTTLSGPTAVTVASYTRACSGGGACIPQPGTSQKLDSLADRLMFRFAYRNRSGVESLLVSHAVTVGTNKRSSVTSVRWYELRVAGSGYSVFQQGTLGATDGIHRWMSSIASDKQGNIALGYSASSGTVAPSIRYTGRLSTDALGTMQTETIIKSGGGSQLANLSRWGDYSQMTIDPVDDCTFWYTNEYLKANGTFNWSTWISSFKFPGCV